MSNSKFIPQPHKKQFITCSIDKNGKRVVANQKDTPIGASLKLIKIKFKLKSNRDGERFTIFWDYGKNTYTLKNYFLEGDPIELTEEISGTAGEMSKVLLADIKKHLKKYNCKTILNMELECNYLTLDISGHNVYFLNNDDKKLLWKA